LSPELEGVILDAAPPGNPKAIEILLRQVEAKGHDRAISDIMSGKGLAAENIIGLPFNPLKPSAKKVLPSKRTRSLPR
jgi:hypothetical protein